MFGASSVLEAARDWPSRVLPRPDSTMAGAGAPARALPMEGGAPEAARQPPVWTRSKLPARLHPEARWQLTRFGNKSSRAKGS